MIIRDNLDTADRKIKYKWYDYVIVYGVLIITGSALFWLLITATILTFG